MGKYFLAEFVQIPNDQVKPGMIVMVDGLLGTLMFDPSKGYSIMNNGVEIVLYNFDETDFFVILLQ
jgi:hypothetical protein